MTFDRFFKLALLALLLVFLVVGWTMRDNGRYVYHPETEHQNQWKVIDSRTGTVFEFDYKGMASEEYHPQTGEYILHYPWIKDTPAKK